MRTFQALLFLGNGQHSVRERQRLHEVLDRALDLSGGLQQPDRWDHEPTSEERRASDALAANMADEIKDAVRDVAAALAGREITFGEVLPKSGSV